jgi:ABC-type Fe3+-hydroxamate transport system substrate-binding protein
LHAPPWNALRAVRAGRVYLLDDAAILERPGPRYNDGLAWLIARLHAHG